MESRYSKLDHKDDRFYHEVKSNLSVKICSDEVGKSTDSGSEDDTSPATISKYNPIDCDSPSNVQMNSAVKEEEEETNCYDDFEDVSAVYCYCQQPRNGRFMICCDMCDNWFHGDCVGVNEDVELLAQKSSFICSSCQNEEHGSLVVEQDSDVIKQDDENQEKLYSKALNDDDSGGVEEDYTHVDSDEQLEDEEEERSKVVRLWSWPDTPTALELNEPQKRWGGLSLQELIVASRDNLKQLRCRGPRCDKLLHEPAEALFCGPDCIKRYSASVMTEVRAAKGLPSDTYTHNLNVALQMAYVHFVTKESKYDLRAYPVARRLAATSQCLAEYLTSRLCEQVLMGPVRVELLARRRRLQQKQTSPQLFSVGTPRSLHVDENDARTSVSETSKIEIAPEQRAATVLNDLLTEDTTSLHGSGHVFDSLCRICNGQQQQQENSVAKPVKKVYPRPRIEESQPLIEDPLKEESVQEKSSKLPLLWNGSLDCYIFDERYSFQCCAYDVMGTTQYLQQDIGPLLKVHARINKHIVDKHVFDSLVHARRGGRSEVVIVRLSPTKEPYLIETYLRLFRVLDKHEKCGAVKIEDRRKHIKDMYLYPLSSRAPIPSAFGLSQVDQTWTNDSNCVGLEVSRPHLLLLIMIRYRGPPPAHEVYDETYETDSPPSTGAPSPPLPSATSSIKCFKSNKRLDAEESPASKVSRIVETNPFYDPAATLMLPSYATGSGIKANYGTESSAYTLLPPPPPPLPDALNYHGSATDAYQKDYSDWHDPLPSETYEYQPQPSWQGSNDKSCDFSQNLPQPLEYQSAEYGHALSSHRPYHFDRQINRGHARPRGKGYQTTMAGGRGWHRGH